MINIMYQEDDKIYMLLHFDDIKIRGYNSSVHEVYDLSRLLTSKNEVLITFYNRLDHNELAEVLSAPMFVSRPNINLFFKLDWFHWP